MPCNEKYNVLAVKYGWGDATFQAFNYDYPIMVCPYIQKSKDDHLWGNNELAYSLDDKVIGFVFANRADESVTKEQIKEVYQVFKEYFDAT